MGLDRSLPIILMLVDFNTASLVAALAVCFKYKRIAYWLWLSINGFIRDFVNFES